MYFFLILTHKLKPEMTFIKIFYKSTLLISISLFLLGSSWGQNDPQPIVIGEKFHLYSDLLNEERELWIYTPEGYQEEKESYGVIYLLDGPGNFLHTSATAQFLSRNGRMPGMIVVGIANTDRTRDLTPKLLTDTSRRFPNAGGADNFLNFISEELIPYIDKNYRTTPYKLLIGHSFGGLFVNHALVHRPEIFNDFISISPSLWWDEQLLVDQTQTHFKSNKDQGGYLYMTMGNEGENMLSGARKLAAVLEESAPENFKWEFDLMESETHNSVPARSTYKGLEFIFEDWYLPNLFEMYETGGIDALDEHFANISKRWSYKLKAPERTINQIGYALLNQDKIDEAIQVFTRNVETYPESSNVYDSLGEAFMKKKDHKLAIKNYKKSIELNPGNENSKEMLAKMGVDISSVSPDIVLPEKVLQKYVGIYQTPQFTIEIYLEGGQLFGKPAGQQAVELVPISKTEFYTKMVEARIYFRLDDQGIPNMMTVQMNGSENIGVRLN